MKTQNTRRYQVWIGCYGGTRGTTIGSLVETMLEKRFGKDIGEMVELFVGGHPKLMEGKVDHPVSQENIEALIQANPRDGKTVQKTAKKLMSRGRKPATPEILKSCDRVYAADSYILGEYAKLAGEDNRTKYQTMMEASGIRHARFGIDMDDIEASTEFVQRVVAPKKQGKEPNPIIKEGKPSFNPKDYPYYNLAGKTFVAGSQEARLAAYADNYQIAKRIANQIAKDIQWRYNAKHPIKAGVKRAYIGAGAALAGLAYGAW